MPSATLHAPRSEAELRFQQLTETLGQVFWIVDLRPRPATTYLSPAFESIWGRPAQAVYDDPALWAECIVAEDRARYHAAYTRWSEQPESAPGYSVEYRIRRPDGGLRWISGRGNAVRDADGEVHRLTGFAEDVTARKQAELAAEQGQRHLRELIDGLPQLLWSSSPNGDCEYVNSQWAEFTGRPLADHLGAGWVDVVHRDDIPDLLRAWRSATAARKPYDCELRLRRRDGSYRWMSMRGVPLCDDAGAVLRWLGSCTDMHELKHAGDALAEEHDRLLKIAGNVPSAIHSYRMEADGRASFPFGAERVADLYGVSPDAVAADASVLYARLHPDDAPLLWAAVRESAEQMAPWHHEYRISHPILGERWIEGRSMPTREPDGSMVWHGALTDITERKQSERALHAGQAKLAAIFDDLSEGLLVYPLDTLRPEFNRAALDIHELPSIDSAPASREAYHEAYALFDLDGQALAQAQWPSSRVLRGERIARCELLLRHRQRGWSKVVSLAGSLVSGLDGEPLAVVLSFSDVTERHRHQAEMLRLNHDLEERVAQRTAALAASVEEMESFSYSVSHDLRAPLRALDGFSQAVLQDYAALLPPDGRHYLQIIRDSAKKMGHLIDDLLAFSRIGRAELKKRAIDPAMLVRDALAVLAPMREGRRIELHIGELPACRGDLALLRQVWVNLISNALKYSRHRDPAQIEIGCLHDEAAARPLYYVRDNGTGFDMRHVGKLFGVFERLHRADEFEGTGVGLAIVQRIVQRHGGSIRAEAEPDRGATFFFELGED